MSGVLALQEGGTGLALRLLAGPLRIYLDSQVVGESSCIANIPIRSHPTRRWTAHPLLRTSVLVDDDRNGKLKAKHYQPSFRSSPHLQRSCGGLRQNGVCGI